MRFYLKKAGLEVEVASAGLHAREDDGAAENTQAVLRELGVEAREHRAQLFRPELVEKYDLILVMTKVHRAQLLTLVPQAEGKVFLLKELAAKKGRFRQDLAEAEEKDYDILDPFGQSLEIYRKSREEIRAAVESIVQNWAGKGTAMKIVIGADHGGFQAKEAVKEFLENKGFKVEDYGTYNEESCDYPEIAHKVAQAVARREFDCGVLICGTGIGMSLAANKVPGIRAGLAHDTYTARMAKAHNHCNVLCLGGRVTGIGLMLDIVDIYFRTDYEGGRHARRVAMIEEVKQQ